MQSIKDIIDEVSKTGNVTIPKQLLEKVIFIMYKYYIEKEPESEFIKLYKQKFGINFDFIKSAIYYIKISFKMDVSITDNGDDTLLISKN